MDKDKIRKIVDAYPGSAQVDIAIEELSELIKALLKHRRMKGSGDVKVWEEGVTEEIADVEIMIAQLKIIFSNEEEVNKWVEYKIDRQLKRIKEREDKA